MKPFHHINENRRMKYITPTEKRRRRDERSFLLFITGFICGGLVVVAVIMLSFA